MYITQNHSAREVLNTKTSIWRISLKFIYYTLWMTIQHIFFCFCFVFVDGLVSELVMGRSTCYQPTWPIYLFWLYWVTFKARLKNNKSPSRFTDDLQTELLFNWYSQYKRTRVGGSQVWAIEFSTWLRVRCQIEPHERWIIHSWND